jgi:DnaJ like chaperone protein
MSWLGKVMGGAFGFLMGGPLGAALGAAVGHRFDQGNDLPAWAARFAPGAPARVQTSFLSATFAVMGHVAKVDGRVSEAEIVRARAIMTRLGLSEEVRQAAIRLFTEGKRADFPLGDVLAQLRQACRRRGTLMRLFMEIQIETALADGPLGTAEERLLLHICDHLAFSRFEFQVIRSTLENQLRAPGGKRRQRTPPTLSSDAVLADAYATLRVGPGASDAELKRAYRRLMSRYHPDKLAASGQSEDVVRQANEKTREIRHAWEIVRRARNTG